MLRTLRYSPRIYTDDALRIDERGDVRSLAEIDSGTSLNNQFLLLNQHELTPTGIREAAQRHRQHWLRRHIEGGTERSKSGAEEAYDAFMQDPAALLRRIRRHTPVRIRDDAPPDPAIATLARVIEDRLPTRLKRFAALDAPLIVLTEEPTQVGASTQMDALGYYFPPECGGVPAHYEGMVIIRPGAAARGRIIHEELEHALNSHVGFSEEAWREAMEIDLARPAALDYIKAHSNKDKVRLEVLKQEEKKAKNGFTPPRAVTSWVHDYPEEILGAEMLMEMNYLYEQQLRNPLISAERAYRELERQLPTCTGMLRGYKQDEQDYLQGRVREYNEFHGKGSGQRSWAGRVQERPRQSEYPAIGKG